MLACALVGMRAVILKRTPQPAQLRPPLPEILSRRGGRQLPRRDRGAPLSSVPPLMARAGPRPGWRAAVGRTHGREGGVRQARLVTLAALEASGRSPALGTSARAGPASWLRPARGATLAAFARQIKDASVKFSAAAFRRCRRPVAPGGHLRRVLCRDDGFAIGSAALVSLALFGAFTVQARVMSVGILSPWVSRACCSAR